MHQGISLVSEFYTADTFTWNGAPHSPIEHESNSDNKTVPSPLFFLEGQDSETQDGHLILPEDDLNPNFFKSEASSSFRHESSLSDSFHFMTCTSPGNLMLSSAGNGSDIMNDMVDEGLHPLPSANSLYQHGRLMRSDTMSSSLLHRSCTPEVLTVGSYSQLTDYSGAPSPAGDSVFDFNSGISDIDNLSQFDSDADEIPIGLAVSQTSIAKPKALGDEMIHEDLIEIGSLSANYTICPETDREMHMKTSLENYQLSKSETSSDQFSQACQINDHLSWSSWKVYNGNESDLAEWYGDSEDCEDKAKLKEAQLRARRNAISGMARIKRGDISDYRVELTPMSKERASALLNQAEDKEVPRALVEDVIFRSYDQSRNVLYITKQSVEASLETKQQPAANSDEGETASTLLSSSATGSASETKKSERVKKPLNSFMMYRKFQIRRFYPELLRKDTPMSRSKGRKQRRSHDTLQHLSPQIRFNHVSQVMALLWNTEGPQVKNQLSRIAIEGKEMHHLLHPEFKYSKSSNKKDKTKGESSDAQKTGTNGKSSVAKKEQIKRVQSTYVTTGIFATSDADSYASVSTQFRPKSSALVVDVFDSHTLM
ncbi:hypothetical protein CANCADRAFT_31361 [Tortispora caseinolytica NRRL Y-17796]|uniref:HMG box domain-containing protein n=1 Tax=Tortispora caseinolytica NRRL Y-17796 TaxID=767744 RepID=A0A1E4TF33_9ASCO|nr:hypothetical protein CANCADRAFT_31361 [Tortispora caseinolytica NRRL Y-17796]